jgi:small subunit ribosomal protein S18
MARDDSDAIPAASTGRSERSDRAKVTQTSESGTTYVDYKKSESLRRLLSVNGKMSSRRRNGVSAHDQRLITQAIKRARQMALLPTVSSQNVSQ